MNTFAIIETDLGLTVACVEAEETPETVAVLKGGRVVDPGPFHSFEDAYDAMLALPASDDDTESEIF